MHNRDELDRLKSVKISKGSESKSSISTKQALIPKSAEPENPYVTGMEFDLK